MDKAPDPEGEQTWEQAVEFAIASFRYACALDGIPKPSDEVIRSGLRPEP